MKARYVLTPTTDTRPSLIADLVERADAAAIDETRGAMYLRGCANGLVVDGTRVVILRDTYASTDADSIQPDPEELETAKLFGPIAGDIADGLERWLRALAADWHATLPHEPWVKALLSDVVPAVSGSVVDRLAAA